MKKVLQKFSQFYKNLPIAKKMATTIIFILAFFLCTVTGLITVIFSKMLISNNSEASNRNLISKPRNIIRLHLLLLLNSPCNRLLGLCDYWFAVLILYRNLYAL